MVFFINAWFNLGVMLCPRACNICIIYYTQPKTVYIKLITFFSLGNAYCYIVKLTLNFTGVFVLLQNNAVS